MGPLHRHHPGVRSRSFARAAGTGHPVRPGVSGPARHPLVRGQRRTHWRAIRGEDFKWVVPHSIRKSVVTAVERSIGLEAAAQQAGHSGSEITRRHYVERSVTVPDYTAALDEYSRPIRAFRPLKSNRPGDIPT